MRRMLLGWMLCAGVGTALAAPAAWAGAAACAPAAARDEAAALLDRVAAAPSVDAARQLALEPTRGAHRALVRARWLSPGTESLRLAEQRLAAYEARIAAAPSQQQVAAELASLVPVKPDVTVGDGSGGCNYSTGEVIATVLGFILGIIPGIILLFLLC